MKFLPTIVMVSLSAVLIGGCGSDTSQEAGAVGTLSLHLSTTSPLQIEYRLRDAIFQIRGPEDRDVSSENYLDDPANQPINEVVRSGVYTVTLAAGWRMEHRASGQAFSDIPATLTSANPLNVTVITDEVTPAIFQFEVEEGQISFGPGTVALQVGVDEIGAEWGTAELIGSNISVDQPFQPLYNPVVAIDAQGNAMAVWKSSSNVDLLGSRFTPSGGWETPELIEPAYSFLGNYQVAMDPQGNAMVVWSHITGSWQSIWANRFTPSGGWGTPELLENNDVSSAQDVDVAVDPQGNAVAVWRERETDHWNIWTNRFTPAGGWGTAGLLENYDGEAARARVAADAAGNVMAVWPQGSAVFSILARRFTPTTGWGPIDLLESDERGHAGSQEVAMDSQGNAMVVWSQDDGTRSNVWANRFTPDGGWGTAALIGSNAKDGQWPAVAMDPQGSAIAIWAEGNFAPPEDTSLFARRFTPTGGWGTIELIEGLTASARFPEVAMDGRGNAVAVWPSFHGAVDPWRSDIWTNRFTPEDGWGAMRLLQNHTWPDAVGPPWLMPSVAMNPAGNAVAVWPQSSNGFSFDAYANHFR